MIANQSASISRSSAFTQPEVPASELTCMNCKTVVALDDLFCQECGVTLVDAQDHEDGHEDEPGVVSRFDRLLALRNFDYAASVKRFSVLIAVVVVSGLSVFAILAISSSYDAMSEDYICDHAKKLLGENDPVQAVDILQRLSLGRAMKLKPQTLELLGQALVKASDLHAGRNQIEQAVKDLKDIPPGTTQYVFVRQRVLALTPKTVPPVALPEIIQPVASEPVVAKAKVVPAPAQAPPLKAAVQPAKPPFAADDVTNYNRLLAAYFEKTGAESEQSADSTSGGDETSKTAKPVSEPPTLKEWVNAGRPDF